MMANAVDITNKLTFDKNPALMIKGRRLEVNADAPTMLKVMALMREEEPGIKEIMEVYNLMFPERSKKEIERLRLSFADLIIVIQSAVSLIVGEDNSRGEQ